MKPRADFPATAAARFVVGIDLGTTNCALAFADTGGGGTPAVQVFPVPQLVAAGETEARETLPSFLLEPAPGELDGRLPWGDGEASGHVVGVLARERGVEAPGRLIASAKSWLSHPGVDRTADLLPWHGDAGVKKLSPAEASARLLGHLRAAWDHAHPGAPLAEQEVVVTIPASFDEVARELTLAAARRAGLPRLALLEEPQAAFYDWMAGGETGTPPGAGERALVCDVGGGTTDFTLIEARAGGGFHRVAVGDHLILGGDNLDLALAHFVEGRLGPPALNPRQWGTLVRRCQGAKETLLGPGAPARLGVSVPAPGGARLVGGARTAEVTREEVVAQLVDGFLPRVPADARPARRGAGFQEFGLPYAPDPGITRYLAAFLAAHGGRVDAVLFNGGFFESPALRERLRAVLGDWLGQPPRVLENRRLDLAVAVGAVRYGLARWGVAGVGGARITGGLARAYYVGAREGERDVAVCLAPAGLAEGAETALETRRFTLRVRQPAEFPLFTSSTRPADRPGDLAPREELTALPPLRTALRGRAADEDATDAAVPVRLRARLTELGTLEVWCAEEDGRRQWKLPFDVRAVVNPDADAGATRPVAAAVLVEENAVAAARSRVRETFGGVASGPADAEGLVKRLETALALPRLEWPPALLRELGDVALPLDAARGRGPIFEARWLNFVGFCLRPGYGFAADDARVATAWRTLGERRVLHPRNELCRAEWAVLWRRLAGGLSGGQQRALAAPILADLRRHGGRDWGRHEGAELWRLLGALEGLEGAVRLDLGNRLLAGGLLTMTRAALWALGRLGARAPLAGPLNTVLPAEAVEGWLGTLLAREVPADRRGEFVFALTQMARRTGDRYRDISEETRERVLARLLPLADARALALVREGGAWGARERDAAFGESLPRGLRLV